MNSTTSWFSPPRTPSEVAEPPTASTVAASPLYSQTYESPLPRQYTSIQNGPPTPPTVVTTKESKPLYYTNEHVFRQLLTTDIMKACMTDSKCKLEEQDSDGNFKEYSKDNFRGKTLFPGGRYRNKTKSKTTKKNRNRNTKTHSKRRLRANPKKQRKTTKK